MDEVWSAGYVGLYRAASTNGAVQQYDDVKIGYDTDSDADITDAGDDIQVSDDFNSNVMTLSYDNNSNLTNDGVYQYVYDGWNRLRKVQRRAVHAGQSDDVTTLGTYAYWPDNRRASKTVAHCGIEAVANDGGDTVVYFYYSNKWQILETRNGSSQATRQWVWGTRYVDEILFMDVNGDPATSNTCDADDPNKAPGTRRYFYHQDRNWNVVALSEYGGDGLGTNGRLAERYAYTPYGEFVVLQGDGGSGELGRVLPASSVGNTFFHQGLAFDQEKGSYQNRHREYQARVQRFAQRDPLAARPRAHAGYQDGLNLCAYARSNPLLHRDRSGTSTDPVPSGPPPGASCSCTWNWFWGYELSCTNPPASSGFCRDTWYGGLLHSGTSWRGVGPGWPGCFGLGGTQPHISCACNDLTGSLECTQHFDSVGPADGGAGGTCTYSPCCSYWHGRVDVF